MIHNKDPLKDSNTQAVFVNFTFPSYAEQDTQSSTVDLRVRV